MNRMFPQAMQLDCRRPGCRGLGYLGSDTVMCFLCEEQWTPEQRTPEQLASSTTSSHDGDLGVLLSSGAIKRCPRCGVIVQKNGGCDHMTCRCRHEFWWSTLRPYR